MTVVLVVVTVVLVVDVVVAPASATLPGLTLSSVGPSPVVGEAVAALAPSRQSADTAASNGLGLARLTRLTRLSDGLSQGVISGPTPCNDPIDFFAVDIQ